MKSIKLLKLQLKSHSLLGYILPELSFAVYSTCNSVWGQAMLWVQLALYLPVKKSCHFKGGKQWPLYCLVLKSITENDSNFPVQLWENFKFYFNFSLFNGVLRQDSTLQPRLCSQDLTLFSWVSKFHHKWPKKCYSVLQTISWIPNLQMLASTQASLTACLTTDLVLPFCLYTIKHKIYFILITFIILQNSTSFPL